MSASFRSILGQVTQEKLEELKLQKNLMTSHFTPVLSKFKTLKSKREALELLYEAVKGSPVKDTIDGVLIDNLKYLLKNSKEDPSISEELVDAWSARVVEEISYALRKCEYSYLYGSLLTEWLEVEEKRSKVQEEPSVVTSNEAKDKALGSLKALMFSKAGDFDEGKFRTFLSSEMFSFPEEEGPEGGRLFAELVKETKGFFLPENYYISSHDVQCCIKGLRSDNLLSQEKKAALQELSENSEALEEVCSLLTSRLKNLDRWEWPKGAVESPLDVRRGMAGEYKAFLNEDIITALFLQYVGVEWASYFKRQFIRIYDSKAWKKDDCKPFSVEGQRREFYRSAFLSSLPDSVQSQENRNQEEYARVEADDCMAYEESAAERCFTTSATNMSFGGGGMLAAAPQMMSRKMMKRSMPPPPRPQPSDIDFKQQFLHTLTTEVKLHQTLRPDKGFLVVQADLESFGPSVVHEAVLNSLEFLGVTPQWLTFFKKFLQPKVKLQEGDVVHKVLRGVPSAHVLSTLFGEVLLFLLDFLINRSCAGMRLYRIADELWFWGHDETHVAKAWDSLVNTFGKMVGLKVNTARSGSVCVKGPLYDGPLVAGPSPLPPKSIHWGYLQLSSNGIFRIDQGALVKFLDEMKGLLDKAECVLEWTNVFNKYFTFFIRNFGKSAVASGKQHLDQIIQSLNKIYEGLGALNPVSSIKTRFPSSVNADIVDAWVYWPLERGGLGLVNPFIAVMALRETFAEAEEGRTEDKDFAKLPFEDKVRWEEMKKEWEKLYGNANDVEPPMQMASRGRMMQQQFIQGPGGQIPKLPSWEEYVTSRETELEHWATRYRHLLDRPGPKYPQVSDQFHTMPTLSKPETDEIERNYFMWLFSYYETQLKGHFGGVTFINSKLLPMSMIANIQKTKVKH